MTQKYSREGDLHAVVAKQQIQIQALRNEIQQERQDAVRYSKLNELAKDYAFDVDEELETCLDMTPNQFERHCSTTVKKYARRDDVTSVDFFDDPAVAVDDAEPARYSRGNAGRPDAARIEKYSREAAEIAVRSGTKFEVEFEKIMKRHGLTV